MRHETGLTRVLFVPSRKGEHELEIDLRAVDAPRTPGHTVVVIECRCANWSGVAASIVLCDLTMEAGIKKDRSRTASNRPDSPRR